MSRKARTYRYAPITGVPPLDNRYRLAWNTFWADLTGYQHNPHRPQSLSARAAAQGKENS